MVPSLPKAADSDEQTGAGADGDQDMPETDDGAPNSTQVKRSIDDDIKKSRGSGAADKAG